MEIIKSVYYTNTEVIEAIMKLYKIERFDLDCTYSKGNFWKDLPQPVVKSDIEPLYNYVIKADSRKLPFNDESFNSVIFDPPFIVGGDISNKKYKKESVKTAKRFGYYKNYAELKDHYKKSIKEIYRILKKDGILVFKCQDIVTSNINYFTHNLVLNLAINEGFYAKDLFILVAKSRLNSFNNSKWKIQRHARKYHSYFWVFIKNNKNLDYLNI